MSGATISTHYTCTVQEAASILKLHSSTVEKLIANGDLPAGRVGQRYIIKTSDVTRYADQVIIKQSADRLSKGRWPKSIHAGLRIA